MSGWMALGVGHAGFTCDASLKTTGRIWILKKQLQVPPLGSPLATSGRNDTVLERTGEVIAGLMVRLRQGFGATAFAL